MLFPVAYSPFNLSVVAWFCYMYAAGKTLHPLDTAFSPRSSTGKEEINCVVGLGRLLTI